MKAFKNKQSIKDKYVARVEAHQKADENGCWVWQRAVSKNTYGVTWYQGRSMSAHKVSYLVFKGEVQEGLCVLHSCDNRLCVNPEHLFLGTNKDNTQDAVSKTRMARGEKQGNSKLKSPQVLDIKRKLASGLRIVDIANEYQVDETTIGKIKSGDNWAWL